MESLLAFIGSVGFILLLGSIIYFFTMKKRYNYSKRNFMTVLSIGGALFILANIFTPFVSSGTIKGNDQLVTTNKSLQAENKQIKEEVKELKDTNDELKVAAEEAKTQLEDLTKQFSEITGQNQELHSRNEELEVKNQELHSKNEELEAKHQELIASANTATTPANNAAVNAASSNQHSGENSQQLVYWTPNGDKYHRTSSCRTLARSKTILSGTISDSHRTPCAVCH